MKLQENEMSKDDLYLWYVDNCTGYEIPLNFKEWEREIYPSEKAMWKAIDKANAKRGRE